MSPPAAYAELHCLSNFSFQRGASHADELVTRAARLGYAAIAITDECSLAGIVRARDAIRSYVEQREKAISEATPSTLDELHRQWPPEPALIVGAEFHLRDGPSFVLLAPDIEAYSQISRLITRGRQTQPKGRYELHRRDCDALDRCLALWLADEHSTNEHGHWLAERTTQTWLAVELHRGPDDAALLAHRQQLAQASGLGCVAAGGVLFHDRARKMLHDVLTAVRIGKPVSECGKALLPNAERRLRSLDELLTLYPRAMLDETLRIAGRCRFDLKQIRYDYPSELVPQGHDATSYLRALTERGMRRRWPQGASRAVRDQIDKELALIAELQYEAFFLTVEDIVREANARGILCQGRGSAANSAVCYALGVTSVNPAEEQLLFERFLSKERNEPPDIDVDFEHERREEIIQYVFKKYGRHRCALAATVISYRTRSALRDVGRALGMEPEDIDRVSKALAWWDKKEELANRLVEQGFDPEATRLQHWLRLTSELTGFPRHLSQHVGGFVISQRPLDELVPIENAAMPGRQVIQWDKDDLESLGLLKVDVLALGMLTALRKCFDLVEGFDPAKRYTVANIPRDDEPTYEMIRQAKTIGVFQIESRAQQSMLPRLLPESFYDLVIQIAIVRPGPITGGMVHPYLQRRAEQRQRKEQGLPPENDFDRYYPSQLHGILQRTLGVPIFQEQVMQIAITAAQFTPGEADQMRRSMAAWKRHGGLEHLKEKLINGMLNNRQGQYTREFAEEIYQRILGFGSYGFPESHSASFALLAYASSYLKCHHPAAFIGSLLNSQPMGFYPPSMLVAEARRSGVEVRAVDVQHSHYECTLERVEGSEHPALRLGLLQVEGLSETSSSSIADARRLGAFKNTDDLARRAGLLRRELLVLANAGALESLSGHRHAARWNVAAHQTDTALHMDRQLEGAGDLRAPTPGEDVLDDYRSLGLSLRQHPLALLRERLSTRKVSTAKDVVDAKDRSKLRVAGMVMFRQRPPTAKGVMFMTIEDETGSVNLILRPQFVENHRAEVLGARVAVVTGEVQSTSGVIHVMVEKFRDVSYLLSEIPSLSRDFH
ncbi:error-prone DNA polymerase [Hydrocarboniphaga effusa]|uniref:error-prone DNA polymerase n=1 Tax=Hydrocarboniphaga effusa TaxID=243629 RepID=UPI00398BC046